VLPAVNVTVSFPVLVNLCVTVLPEPVPPSPNFQFLVVGVFVLVSANVNVVAVVPPDAGDAVKEATGNFVDVPALTITDFVLVALPAPLVAVNLTVYVPAVAYLCVTFLAAPRGVVLSPKSQDHEVGVFVLVSVNV